MRPGGERPAAGPPEATLALLDARVEAALASGDESGLPVLGYGEVSLVLGWPREEPRFACKRLPVFSSRARFESYGRTLADYLAALRERGVRVVHTELRGLDRPGGSVAGYVVQPILPPEQLAPEVLARADPAAGHPLVAAVAGSAARVVDKRIGLDAQLSNWVWDGSDLVYIDVSTPMLWDREGRPRLDLDLLADAFPWLLRAPLRRFAAPRILDTYRDLRKVYFDLCGNLIKQRLEAWLPAFLEQAARHLERPLTEDEVRAYYRFDRRLWAALLGIRRLDRAWQRRVRRRPYPFLLPGRVQR